MAQPLTLPFRMALWCAALTLAAVSIACEILLLTSHTEQPLDTAIAVATGTALVASQYLFAALSGALFRQRRRLAGFAVALITTVLLVVSIAGSTGFLESRYTTDQTANTQRSDAYQLRQQAINGITEQQQELTNTAETARAKGNTWYAGQLLDQAQQLNQQRLALVAELSTLNTPASNSASALALAAGQARWVLWGLLATLIDLCPVLVFALLGSPAKVLPSVKTPKAPSRPTPKQSVATADQRPSEHPIEQMKQAIRQGVLGSQLGIRAAMRTLNTTNYSHTRQAFDELIEEGFLIADGKGFHYANQTEGTL